MTLMDATTDKDFLVHEQIFSALVYLGQSEPEEILNACEEYLRQHDKVEPAGGALLGKKRGNGVAQRLAGGHPVPLKGAQMEPDAEERSCCRQALTC